MPIEPFARIRGHDPTIRLLTTLLEAGRLPQSIIFDGVPGCGRRTLALALAGAYLCTSRREGDACGACASCRMWASGNHPDLVVMPHDTEEAEVPVKRIREEVVLRCHETALTGNGRVFVIPGIERLRPEATNALLKVLEEPSPGVLIALTTSAVDGLLDTIRSRCQTYRLQALAAEDIAAILVAEGVPAEEAEARAATAHGSLRRARETRLAAAPVDELSALLEDGYDPRRCGELLRRLTAQAEELEGGTPAAQRRQIMRQWLDALRHHLQQRLRASGDPACVAALEKVLARHGELKVNLPPQLILESLGL